MDEELRKVWENLSYFNEPDDIPNLPSVNEEEWKTFFVPILIKNGAIPKKDLIIGREYIGSCRNSDKAKWIGEKFEYQRQKFNFTFTEEINHFEDDDGYDLFVPLKLIEN